jgi:hypothetical protein
VKSNKNQERAETRTLGSRERRGRKRHCVEGGDDRITALCRGQPAPPPVIVSYAVVRSRS